MYSDPLDFNPERFLPGGDNYEGVRTGDFVFGYGRRICPGQTWADHMLFNTAATLIASFDLEQAEDADGNLIPLNENYEGESVRYFEDSECKISPRTEKYATSMRQYAESF